MQNYVFRKSLVIGIIILFFGASVVPSISMNIENNCNTHVKDIFEEELNLIKDESNKNVCNWPMFRHDSIHNGYTDCKGKISKPYTKWAYPTKALIHSSPSVGDINDDGELEIVFCAWDGNVYALKGINGDKIWKYNTGLPMGCSPALGDVDDDGQIEVIFGSTSLPGISAYICVLNGKTGTLEESYIADNCIVSPPNIGDIDNDGDIEVVIGSYDDKVYVIDHKNRIVEWTFSTDANIHSSPALGNIDYDDNLEIVIGSQDGNVYALDGEGGLEWEYPTGDKGVISSPALGDSDKDGSLDIIVFGCNDHNVYGINCNGDYIWNYPTEGLVQSSPALADIDNDNNLEVFVGSRDNNIYALKGETGELIWDKNIGGMIESSPALGDIDNDGDIEVVIGSPNTNLYCMDGLTGDIEWVYPTNGFILSSPAIADVDGDGWSEIVIGSDDFKLHVLNEVESPPTKPVITGPTRVGNNKRYWYFHSDDAEGDLIYYEIYWDDGTKDESDWVEPGEPFPVDHAYTGPMGFYWIRARAIECYSERASGFSEYRIEKPRNRAIQNTMFLWFLEQFPILQKLLLFQR
jgi:outer membrane protein assembly factor BamB